MSFNELTYLLLLYIIIVIASVILPILRASTAQNPSPDQVLSKTQQKKQARANRVKYN